MLVRIFCSAALFSLFALSSGASLSGTSTAYPPPEPCLGNCTFVHDPNVIRRSDGTWIRFSTGGGIAIATAPALKGPWTYEGSMLPSGSKIRLLAKQSMWAPDVHFTNGQFYAYYSVSRPGYQGSENGVATSKSAVPGTWTDHGSTGIPHSPDYNMIDGTFFKECDTCKHIFTFGSAWKGIQQTTLKDDDLTWSGEAPYTVAFNSTYPKKPQGFPSIVEGSYLFAYTVKGKKYYYLFFSSGACCKSKNDLAAPGDEYKVMVCRSETTTGPYYDANGKSCATQNGGTSILASHGDVYAPGGQGVMVDPDSKKPVIYYHYVDPKDGYSFQKFLFGYNYLDFSSGWPVVTQ